MNYQEFFDKAKELGFSKVQLTIYDTNASEVKVSNDEVIYNQSENKINYGIMARINDNVVTMASDYLDLNILNMLKSKANIVEEKNDNIFLSDTSKNVDFNVVNPFMNIVSDIEEIKKLNSKRDNLISKINTDYQASSEYKRIINSDGVDISTTSCTYYCYMCLINESDKATVVEKTKYTVNRDDINLEEMVNELREELSIKLKEEEIDSGKYNVIIKPSVMKELLRLMISGLYIERVHEKTTYLSDKLNNQVFSSLITLREEPLNKNYPGYSLFDDEGTFTYNKNIIENGILKTYLYNNKYAIKDNVKSTGNAFSGLVRNAYIVPGERDFKDLVSKLNNGLIIDECMGYHASVKINDGSISLQSFGMIVRDGKIVSSFKPVVMTTTFEELFNNVEEVGSDLEFTSSAYASPSILVNNISIASK